MSVPFAVYGFLAEALFPLFRERLRRKNGVGFDERCGVYDAGKREALTRMQKRRLWLHAVSVGEVQAAAPIVEVGARSGLEGALLLSTVTVTGRRHAEALMKDRVFSYVYAPWDVPSIVRRACGTLAPSLYATVETEIWPNLLRELKSRGVHTCLLNARVSDRVWSRSRAVHGLARLGYDLFDGILARGEEDARRLCMMGLREEKIHVVGDCKVDAIVARRAEADVRLPSLKKRLMLDEASPLFVAGSTHEGEEAVVLEAFSRLVSLGGVLAGARLVVAPRHPERAEAVAARSAKYGRTVLFSRLGDLKGEETAPSIVVVDEIGVLFDLYGLAMSAFVGGSLVPRGGQNILEPAIWGIPVLHGPYMDDFAEPAARLDEDGRAYPIVSAEELAVLWRRAFEGTLSGGRAPERGYFSERSGAAERTWAYLQRHL